MKYRNLSEGAATLEQGGRRHLVCSNRANLAIVEVRRPPHIRFRSRRRAAAITTRPYHRLRRWGQAVLLRPPASLSPPSSQGGGGFALPCPPKAGQTRARAALRLPKAKQAAVVATLRHPPPGEGRPWAALGEYPFGGYFASSNHEAGAVARGGLGFGTSLACRTKFTIRSRTLRQPLRAIPWLLTQAASRKLAYTYV